MDNFNFALGTIFGAIAFIAFCASVAVVTERASLRYQERAALCIQNGGSWITTSGDYGAICLSRATP